MMSNSKNKDYVAKYKKTSKGIAAKAKEMRKRKLARYIDRLNNWINGNSVVLGVNFDLKLKNFLEDVLENDF